MADEQTPPEQPEDEAPAKPSAGPADVPEQDEAPAAPAQDEAAETPAPVEPVPEAEPDAADAQTVAPVDPPPEAETEAVATDAAPAGEPAPAADPAPAAEPAPAADAAPSGGDDADAEPTPRLKPEIPGADLEVDIVGEGGDPLVRGDSSYAEDEDGAGGEGPGAESDEDADDQPIAAVTINLAADARYRATGKRKTAVARVTLRPGKGAYAINGRELDEFFPRDTLQRTIRQPLETVGYADRMDVVARLHGGGVSSQAGALRHGISKALLEADPNLRGELKRRGFLTRDARVKERKKAGLKKARKRPQFSKR